MAIAPEDVRRADDVPKLRREAWENKDYWFLINSTGEVVITKQRSGAVPEEKIHIPLGTFRRMVAWYQREQDA